MKSNEKKCHLIVAEPDAYLESEAVMRLLGVQVDDRIFLRSTVT